MAKKYLVHTILHIEYSAIDLAIDATLRFKNLPIKYYKDWLGLQMMRLGTFTMLEKLKRARWLLWRVWSS